MNLRRNSYTHWQGQIQHSTTHQGHSLSVAAALAVQKIIHEDNFLSDVQKKGEYLRNTLNNELVEHPFFYNVRGRGLRNSVEYRCPEQHLFGNALAREMKEKHNILISGKWHRVCFSPALTITFEELETPRNNLASEIISDDGIILGKYFIENRTKVKRNEIPENLINALIATEDIRFKEHSGIDARSLSRAVVGGVMLKSSGGASTISQQLAKMLFTEKPSSGIDRVMQKVKEWIIAIQLEKRYTKDEILTLYLNRFDWINNAVGINSASAIYFNKEPINLNIQESAMLVGMLKNPSLYNPKIRLKLTKERRNVVLSQMNKYDFISDALYETLKKTPIVLDFKQVSHNKGLAPYFRESLRLKLSAKKPDKETYIKNSASDKKILQRKKNIIPKEDYSVCDPTRYMITN